MAKLTRMQMEKEIKALIAQYAPAGTKFAWGDSRRAFGTCSYNRNRLTGECYNFRIRISFPMAINNEWEVVRRTVLHEIAHSRAPGHHHDAVWQKECKAIGGDGQRCYVPESRGGDVTTLPEKFIGTCPVCGMKIYRNRRCRGYHTGCGDSLHLFVWEVNRARRSA